MAKKRRARRAARPKRGMADLKAIWEDVVYEIQMLGETGRFLSTFKANPSNDRDRVTQNAFIESFAIHARGLMAFLYPSDPRPDDVIADDFFDDPFAWRSKRPPMSEALRRIHPRVGKEIAHLTYSRSAVLPEEKRWPFAQIVVEMGRALQEFLRLLPSDFIKPETAKTAAPSDLMTGFTSAPTPVITEVGSKSLR